MNGRNVLLGHVESLVGSISEASARLQANDVDGKILKRIRARFEQDLTANQQQIVSLRERVKAMPPADSLEGAWLTFEKLRSTTESVLAEYLAFFEGAFIRDKGFDGGLCTLTDAMLYDLGTRADLGWNRFTILADGELFVRMSGIIRIRFPEMSVWHLPIGAHELGHFVASTWNDKDKTLARLVTTWSKVDSRNEAYLNEYFADLFATYAMGPCYVMLCALTRFSPSGAHVPGERHPPAAHRVWWMLETLRAIDRRRAGGFPQYAEICSRVETQWAEALAGAGQPAAIESSHIGRLKSWLDDLLNAIDMQMTGPRYGGWFRAQALAEALRTRHRPALAESDRIPDVLNAAWICRLDAAPDSYQVTWLADNALELCRQLAARE